MTRPSLSIDDVFLEAAELPDGPARQEYLDRVCGTETEFRSRVDRLLAAIPKLDSFLESPAYQSAVPTFVAQLLPSLDQTGQLLGPYKLLQKIGEGGMGTVYLAEQSEPVQRRVAIKVVRAGLGSAQIAARFEQERVALGLMEHPNIARVLDAGSTPDGRPYFAMELVKGIPLTEYCDQERLSIEERIRLFLPVCRAVQHAHQKGIIHRDLKPSNVIVGLYDGDAIPKIIDFGVAKVVGQRLIERTMFTELGQIVGTMEYMAPEQAELNNLDIDTRADIYSLGALLYELLTGSTPFTAQQLRSAGLSEMLRMIKDSDPAKPSTRVSEVADLPRVAASRRLEPKRLASLIHGELDWITLKCLEKNRSRRYESATGLANDLERYLANESVLACPPSARYRLGKALRRHRAWVLTASFFTLLLLAGIIAQTVALVAVNRERSAKVAALAAEAKRRKQAQSALDAMSSSVIEGWLAKQPMLLPEHKDFLHQALEFYEDFASQSAEDEESRLATANAYHRVAKIRYRLGENEDIIKAIVRSRDLFRDLVRDFPDKLNYHVSLSQAYVTHSDALCRLGRYADAEPELREAVNLLRELTSKFPTNKDYRVSMARTLAYLGVLMKDLGRLAEGEHAFNESIALSREVTQISPEEEACQVLLAHTHIDLANLLSAIEGREQDAAENSERAVAIYNSLIAKNPTSTMIRSGLAIAYGNQSQYYINLDRYADAEASTQRGLEIREKLVAEFPSVLEYRRGLAMAFNNLGIVFKETDRLEEAEEVYRKSLSIHQELAADHPENPVHRSEVGGASVNLARLLMMRNNPAGARTLLEASGPMLLTALQSSPNHPVFRRFYRLNRWRLAEALIALNEHELAAKVAEEFLEYASERPRDAMTAACLLAACAGILANPDEREEGVSSTLAISYGDRAIAALRQAVAEGYADVNTLLTDKQLDPLRTRPEFQEILSAMQVTKPREGP